MKITYIHQYFNTPQMSGSTRSYEMARRLVNFGHDVNMITSWRVDDGRRGGFVSNESGINVHWLPVPYSNYMNYKERLRSFVKFSYEAARKAAQLPSDIVFASSTPLTIALPAIYAAHRKSVPMVFEVRDLWPDIPIAIGAIKHPILKWLAKRLELFAYRHSDLVVALSPGMKEGVVLSGYPPDRVIVITNCSNLTRFSPDPIAKQKFRAEHGIPQDAILVTYTGTLGKINGVAYLVDLAELCRGDRRLYFLTVGDGAEFMEVKRLAERAGCLGTNFKMLPPVPKIDVPKVLAATDIAISTTIPLKELEANSANKFFDGLAAGCCIAVNHGGWLAELIETSGAGFRLSTDIEQAACDLCGWIDNQERIFAAKCHARKLAEERFSIDMLAAELERVLVRAVTVEGVKSIV